MPWPNRVTSPGERPACPEHGKHGGDHSLALVGGGRGDLRGHQAPARDEDRVGEGATDIDAHEVIRPYHRGDSRPGGTIPPSRTALGLVAVLALAPPVAAAAAPSAAPGGILAAPAELSPGPANGDLAAGLAGWTALGRDAPSLLAPGARLAGNLTLVSPPVLLPAGAQTLRVAARARGSGGLLQVLARTDDGAPDVPLAALELGVRRRSWPVGVAALEGRTVRIVLDPVPALGTTVDVLRVGPVIAPLPGWAVRRGTLEVSGGGRRRAVRVPDAPLTISSPVYAAPPGPRRRAVSVAIRGEGVVRLRVAGRTAVRRATAAWRQVAVTLPRRGRTRIAVTVVATPGARVLWMRDLGTVRRAAPARSPGRSGGS